MRRWKRDALPAITPFLSTPEIFIIIIFFTKDIGNIVDILFLA